MVQSRSLRHQVQSEAELTEIAMKIAVRWHSQLASGFTLGLSGGLGAGKTTWTRAMLRGLGYKDRVPSPTFAVLEPYEIRDLSVIHLDLYRLSEVAELEPLGVRDWLGQPNVWVIAEWPDRVAEMADQCDVLLALSMLTGEARELVFRSRSHVGDELLRLVSEILTN